MNTLPRSLDLSQSSSSSAFEQALSPEVLRESVPAAFAPSAHERLSESYTFVPKCACAHLGIYVVTGHMWRTGRRSQSP